MAKQRIQDSDSTNERAEDDQYAPTDEELYEKAVGLLEKCQIEIRA